MFRGQLPRLAFIYIPWSTACKKAYKEIKCVQYAHRHYLTMVLSGELRFFLFILVGTKHMHCTLTFWRVCAYNDL